VSKGPEENQPFIPLAERFFWQCLQSYGIGAGLEGGYQLLLTIQAGSLKYSTIISLTGGQCSDVAGEQINTRGIGNGIS